MRNFTKIILGVAVALMFIGCPSVTKVSETYATVKDTYKTAREVYRDAKYVVYELKSEKKRIDDEGFGAKSSAQNSSSTK